jgi:uncharacterized protein YlxP (DUF503 family)
MFFAVAKFTFEQSGREVADDGKELRNLVEKIRARFKVSCAIVSKEEDEGTTAIAVAALGGTEEALDKSLDGIAEFCENAGFGRIESEQTLLDHIDALDEYVEDDTQN